MIRQILFSTAILSAAIASAQVPSYVPTDGLVAWYPFDGNANDESGNGNDGVNTGGVPAADRNGNPGSCYYFSGAGCGTRVDANVNTSAIVDGLTISVWASRTASGCIGPRLLEFFPSTGFDGPGSAQWIWNSGIIRIGSILSNGLGVDHYIPEPPIGQWIHLVYTHDGTTASFFRDGVLDTAFTRIGDPILAGDVAFGRMNHPAFDAFNGRMDDIGVWNRALTPTEVLALYSGTASVPACTTPADTLSRRYTAADRFNDVVPVDEQGYLLSGRVPGAAGMYAQRVDCGGAVLWSRSFTAAGAQNDATGAVDRGDGTYWVAGGLSPAGQSLPDGTVLTLDAATGAELDRLQLGGTAADFFTSISSTADGGAVLAGSWNSFGGEDAWLVRLSATGDTVWSRVVDAGQEERFNDALEIGGTYFAVGRRRIPILGGVLSQGLMARYDASGNQIWRKNGLDSVEWFDMAEQVGGGFVAAGQKRYGSGDIVLAAASFDANGNVIWSKEYGLRGEVSFAGSIAAVSGGYILAGRRESSGEAWLLRLDFAGNVLDEEFVRQTPTGANLFTEVVPMPDGQRFAVSGFAGVNPAAVQGWLWVGRLDCAVTGFDPLVDVLSLCDGDSAVLDAGSGFASYAWSTGQTAASIAVSASGTYAVTVTSPAGCTATDSVVVMVNPLPAIGLGADTLGFCGVDSGLISAPAGFASYLWSTGATTPDAYVSEDGWYALTVTDAAGCTARDSVLVSILRASLQQGDTTICAGESLILDMETDELQMDQLLYEETKAFNGPWNLSWNVEPNRYYVLEVSGLWTVGSCANNRDAAFTGLLCGSGGFGPLLMSCPPSYQDTWRLEDNCPVRPDVDEYRLDHIYKYTFLNSDATVDLSFSDCCYGDNSGNLTFKLYSTMPTYETLWSTGDTTATIDVTPSVTTTYYVTISNGIVSCTDSVVVTVNTPPVLDLGADTLGFCGVDSALISAPAGFASYQWSTGATTPDVYISEDGWYALTVTDAAGCTARDSVLVSILRASLQQGDTTICAGEPLTLSVGGVSLFRNCGDLITDVGGNVYRTVPIGDQCWMQDNLATETYRDGSAIPTGLSNSVWQATTSGAAAVYGGDPANKGTYGLLYNWYAVADSKGLCPDGWSVPTEDMWTDLIRELDTTVCAECLEGSYSLTAGLLMKSSPADIPPWNGNNLSGFSGLPGGVREPFGVYNASPTNGYWWSLSESSIDEAWLRELGGFGGGFPNVYRRANDKGYGFSVRCVRDE